MKRYTLLVCLFACVLAASSGCCHLNSMFCYPFGRCIAVCDPTPCGVLGCGSAPCETCGPACAGDCVSACEPCADSCAAPCGDVCSDASCGSCDGCGYPYGPLSWLYRIFSCGYRGSGCGECYWSDFHSEPPDCCDPCDRQGNWTGGGYSAGCGQWGGWGGGCATCSGGTCQSSPSPRGYLAGNQPSMQASSQGQVITDPSSQYAPRVVSVTERVVSPTPTKAASVEQTAAKQVVKQRLTTIPR